MDIHWESLYRAARQAAAHAYCPYSGFRVGAALLCEDGTVVTGCNVENASYGATICAERNALFAAVASGHRSFTALALAAGQREPATPCGICRQVLSEFCPPEMPIGAVALEDGAEALSFTLRQLLPHGFKKNTLF